MCVCVCVCVCACVSVVSVLTRPCLCQVVIEMTINVLEEFVDLTGMAEHLTVVLCPGAYSQYVLRMMLSHLSLSLRFCKINI